VFLVLLPLILPPTKKKERKKERKKEEDEEGRKTTQSQIWTCSTFNKPNTPPLRR
jgi:hypothetical protein